jgi:hypothetical protein
LEGKSFEDDKRKEKSLTNDPTRGKPAYFFNNGGPNASPSLEQMEFVWAFYPKYSSCPHTILDWLKGEALRLRSNAVLEQEDLRRRQEARNREAADLEERRRKAAIEAMPTKGKPASFFAPSEEQMQFL